jgi:DNA adenine methylase
MKYKRPTAPFFSRVGGKTRLAAKLVKMIPEHDTYVEPFIGGGAVFFKKEPSNKEVINDKDKLVYNLYRDMRSTGDRVKGMDFRCSRKIFQTAQNSKATTPFRRLHQNLIIVKHSYSAIGKSYMGDKSCVQGRGSVKNVKASGWRYKERLKNVIIRNQDWKTVARRYDSPKTFFYFDPPYMTKKGTWGYDAMAPAEIARLLKKLKGKWILSYENTPEMTKLFRSAKYTTRRVRHVYELSGQRQNVTEVVIRNF